MKKLVYLLLVTFIAFTGCDDDDDGYSLNNFRVDIATVENANNDAHFYLRRDDGVRLWVTATNYPGYRPRTGQRVLADYTLLSDRPDDSYYDHDVRLNSAYSILTKDVVKLTPANEEMIGDDAIGIRDMWIGSDYLNIRFYYQGYNKTHFVNLVIDESNLHSDGKIHLEFRHNQNGDASTYRYNGIVSFDLQSLVDNIEITTNTMDLVIHVKEYNNEEKLYPFTFRFDEENSTYKEFDRDDFEDNEENDVE